VTSSTAAAADNNDDDDCDDGVEAKRPRLEDDDADMSLSWPRCFTTDRLADSAAVMPFER